MIQVENIPLLLKPIKQWVCWRYEESRKVPVNPHTLGNAGANWSNTWGTLKEATEALKKGVGATKTPLEGVGFVLTSSDPFLCVDLDDCVSIEGLLTHLSVEILEDLNSYTEFSPSGKGLHVWMKVKAPKEINHKFSAKGVEVYSFDRWMTFTGKRIEKRPASIEERTSEVLALISRIQKELSNETEARKQRIEREYPTSSDSEIWQKLFNGNNGQFFKSLYNGDITVVGEDDSRAVIMLGNTLALFTKFDAAAMKRLLLQTGLNKDKWFERRGKGTWLDWRIQDCIEYMTIKGN